MPMWLNKASLLHLPLLEPFKQDVTVSSSEPTMFTFASTRRATVQFSILMLLGTIPGYVASICIHICVGKLVCSASRFAYFDSYWSCTAAVLDYMTDIESQHLQVIALNRSVSFVHGWPLCGAVEPGGAQVASSGECFLQLTAGGMPLGGQLLRLQRTF